MIGKLWSKISLPYKIIGLVLILAGFFILINILMDLLIEKGKAIELAKCNAGKVETINENISIRQKQDNVAPITGKRDLIERLRDGSAL